MEPIENGIDAKKRKQQEFLVLAERFRNERDPEQPTASAMTSDGYCLRDEILAICHRARARFTGQFEVDQFLTIFGLIRAGFGVSVVPEMGRSLSAGCRLIEIEPKTSRRVGYIRLQRRYLSKPLEAFTGYLQESVAKRNPVKGPATASALAAVSLDGNLSKRPR